MAGDPIDDFMAQPEAEQLKTLQGMSPEDQEWVLGQVKQRRGKPAPTPYTVPKSGVKYPSPTGEQIVQQQQDIHPYKNPVAQAAAGPVRAVWNAVTSPYDMVKAAVTPIQPASVLSTSPEEQAIKTTAGMLPLPAPIGEAVTRLGYKMVVKPAVKADTDMQAELKAGHPFRALGTELGAIPVLGAMGNAAGERMAAGDIPGATTETVANAFMLGAPETTGAVVGKPVSAVLNKFNIEPKLRAMLQNMTGTGPELTEDAVNKTIEDAAKLNKDNAEAAKAYRQEFGKAAAKNADLEARQRAQAQAEMLQKVQGSQLVQRVNKLRDEVGAKASANYDAVKAKVGDDSVPRQDMIDAVEDAKKKWIRGSADSTKEFEQIIKGVTPETEASVIAEQFQKAYGHKTMSEALQDERVTKALEHELTPDQYKELTSGYAGMTFNDLQGFYEELGAKLARGGMPSDIYNAVKDVHSALGDKMEEIADRHGVKSNLVDARKFYREYMQTFRDSDSPVAKIADTQDPRVAVQVANRSALDNRMAKLREYSPDVGKLVHDLQQTSEAAKKAVSGKRAAYPASPEAKPLPEAPDAQALKAESLPQTYQGWKKISRNDLARLGVAAVAPFLYHSLFGLEAGAGAARFGIPRLLDQPRMIEWLSKPNAEDMAALQRLPQEYQADVARQMQNFIAQQPTPVDVSPMLQDWLQKGAATETKTEPKSVDKSKRKHP